LTCLLLLVNKGFVSVIITLSLTHCCQEIWAESTVGNTFTNEDAYLCALLQFFSSVDP